MIDRLAKELQRSPYYVVHLQSSSGKADTNFVRVKDYSVVEFNKFEQARDNLDKNIFKFNDLFLMVDRVYKNIIEAYDSKLEAVASEGNMGRARDDLVDLNAYFISFIANMSMYLSCVPRAIGSKRKEIFEGHRQATNIEYDSNFSYRLLYHLRNYALHNTPPITGTRGSSFIKDGERGSEFDVYIEKSIIIEDTKVAKKLADDFETSEDHFPVMECINEVVRSLNIIHWKTIKLLLEEVEEDITLIKSINQLTKDGVQPYIAQFSKNQASNNIDAQLHFVPTHILGIQEQASKY